MGISKNIDANSQNTDYIAPVDATVNQRYGSRQNAYEMGFSSASGVRSETFESLGAVKHPETRDHALEEKEPENIAEENAGLAEAL